MLNGIVFTNGGIVMKSIKIIGKVLALTLLISPMWSVRAEASDSKKGGVGPIEKSQRIHSDDLLLDRIDILLDVLKEARRIRDKYISVPPMYFFGKFVRSNIVVPAGASKKFKVAIVWFNSQINSRIKRPGWCGTGWIPRSVKVGRAFKHLKLVFCYEIRRLVTKRSTKDFFFRAVFKEAQKIRDKYISCPPPVYLLGQSMRSNIVVPVGASEGLEAAIESFNIVINYWKPLGLGSSLSYEDTVNQALDRLELAINDAIKENTGK